jgi:hypothetical protein
MAATLALAQGPLFAASAGVRGLKYAALAVLVTLGLAAYAGAGQFAGAFDLREAWAMLRRRRPKAVAPGT